MANKKNIETNKKSNELEQKKATQKKKLRLHSHLKVNIPLFQSLIMILPSLAKHASAEGVDNYSNEANRATENSVAEKDVTDDHGKANSSAVTHQESPTSENHVGSTLSVSHAPHGSNSHLVPSHHLSTFSHPQVHYIPSISMPAISLESNGQPTHSNNTPPTTPASLVTFVSEVIKGAYGELHVDANGQYTFVLNPNSPQYILLNQNKHGTDHFVLNLSDGSKIVVQIPVTGKQDTPTISGDLAGVVTEDHKVDSHGLLHANGKIDVIDPDQNESSMKPEVLAGKYGSLSIDADGHWQYHVDNSLSNIQALTSATSLHESFVIHTQDGTPQTLDMTIGGNDDNAVVTGIDTGVVTEDVTTQIQGQLTVNDSDLGENHFQASQINGHLGTLTITKDGAWTYALDNSNPAVQRLAQGSTATDIITVHSADGTAHQVTVTITGTGDAATIGGVDTGSIIENTAGVNMSPDYAQPGIATLGNTTLYADGKLTITDPDVGESGFERQGSNGYDYHGTYGDLILLTDGTWHYHADAGHLSGIGARPTTRGTAIDQLGEGQSLTDTITVHSKDGTTHDIVITIHGSNDRPYCSSEVVLQSGSEDTRQTLTTAQLLANTVDVDKNDAGKLTIENLHADHGSILINGDGTFTFTPEKDYNGDAHFSYDVKDAHGGVTHTSASMTLTAVNDNPDVTPLTDSVSEGADNHHTLNLLLGATDKEGDALTIRHLEYAIDGQPQAGKIPAGITLDADGHTLIVDATNPAFNHLANGQSQQIAITYQVEDGHGGSTQQTATLTIAGTDDKATLVSNVIQLTETQALDSEFKSYRGQLQLIDPDSGDHTQFVFSGKYLGQGFAPGHLDVWPNGTYQFKLDAGTNRHADELIGSLHAGESKELPYEVETSDGQKLTIMVKVTGEDNQAKIAVTPYSSLNSHVYEDHTSFGHTTSQLSSGGTLQVIDPDHDQAGFIAQTITTAEGGRFNINAQGHWSYNIDNDKVQHLGAGESFQQTFTVESIDGSAKKDITVTVHGTNDAPIASAEVRLANGLEDSKIVLTPALLLANTTDIDDNDIGKLSIENLHADHGSILINGDGTFTFTPEKDYNGDVHFSYDVKDAHGGVTHTGASTTLAAVQDNAVIAGIDIGSVTEDLNPHASVQGNYAYKLEAQGSLSAIDPDKDESGFDFKTLISAAMHPEWRPYSSSLGGQLAIDPKGNWNYYIDNRKPEIQHLGKGETLTDTVTVHSKDGTTHDIVITIHGTNDAPTVSSEVQLNSGKEDSVQTITTADLLAHATDIDNNDQGQLTVANLIANHGSIRDNQDGTFTFTPEKDYNGDVHFSYDVKDAHGGVTHTGATTNLAAVNDNPDVTPLTDSVSEGADNHHTLNLLVGATDKDGDALSVSHLEYAIDGQPQSGQLPTGITLDADGHTLIVDATDPAFNHLANGQSQQIAITYQVEDGHGGSTQQTATLTIAGTDDKATLVSNVIQLTETQALDSEFKSYGGQLQLIDPDSGDNTQFVFSGKYLGQGFAPGYLDVWPNGSYQFKLDAGTNRHADELIGSLHAGESKEFPYEVETSDGQKLTIMVKVTGEDNQAKIAVTPYSSLNNHVYEDHTSFGNTTSQLSSGGTLQVIDPDHDQAGFIAQTITTAEGGQFNINAQGHWSYNIDNDKVQHLGAGESFQQTFTVESIDGSAKKDITVTVHGTNDAPVASAEVRLANGLEDNKIVLTPAQLLANTSDVDDNDIGKLSIENLQADHGSILINGDGTFTFTPEKDYNGAVHFSYDVKDAHGGVTHTGASTTLSAVGDKAQIAGVDTGSITENSAGVDMSPDYAHSGIATLGNTTLYADGKLTITDPDVGESGFERQGSNGYDYHGTYGDLILLTDGTWHYHADAGHLSGIGARPTTRGTAIDQLGEGQSLTDTITVHSKDGTTHDIVITIHGSNDRPYCSSEVVLANGSEDTRQTLTTAQLLANTVDVDANDAGKLTIENLHADHGSILNNADGTFTFTPEKDYNGDVHFRYDVKDAHGGVTHTGATTNLAAVNDNPDVTPLTDSVSEGADNHHTLNLLVGATDKDGDALSVSHLEYAIDGQPQSGQLPTGITLDTDGHTLIVDATNPAFNHLANGQSQQIAITYQVEDGHGGSTQQTATLTITGTDDKATLVSNVIQLTETQALDSEFKSYRGQLQLIDPDSGDNTQFVFSGKYLGQGFAPGHLDVWPNGTYQFKLDAGTNRHADELIGSLHAGESKEFPYEVETTDGQKLTIMVKVTGEDNQAKIAVTPYSSLNNHVYEDHTSFGNTTSQLSSGGTLQVIDPDHDQAGFIAQTITTAEGGRFNINAQGQWSYDIDNDKVQHLGAGESFQQTFTVESIDGSAKKDITVTVHGTNDSPVASAEVRLANGLEDNKIVLTTSQLLANTSDVDDNDIGKLSIENLQADHGAIAFNTDGTFTFTPEKDYNGDVHFSYDVKDAHGGVTHTGASTTLSAVGDAAIFAGDKSGQITEDRHVQGDAQHTIFVTGVLNVIDPDAGEDHFYDTRNAHALSDPYGGHLTIGKAGDWAYSVPNANIQHLAAGQVEQVQYEVTTAGGDKQVITLYVHGTNDKPIISEVIAGAHNIDEDAANATSGQIIISDVDHSDQHAVSIDSQHPPQYGSVSYNNNSQTWVYTLNNNNAKVNALNDGDKLTDKFSILVDDGHGGVTQQEIEMSINGHSDIPPMPTLVAPAQISGSAGHQDLHASIGFPPIIHQGTPTPMTGWGISDHHGHSLTALHGQFGTLHVNPATGELSYDYQQPSSGVVKTHTGGSYGNGTDETDSFVLTLGGNQNSQVAVHLHLHSQSVHGNSGHHIDQTTLTGMDIAPINSPAPAATVQHDEPDVQEATTDEFSVDIIIDDDSVSSYLSEDTNEEIQGEHADSSSVTGAVAYLDALGINPTQQLTGNDEQHSPADMDLVWAQSEQATLVDEHGIHIDVSDALSDQDHQQSDHHSRDHDENYGDQQHQIDNLPEIDPNS
ncbi:VCBS domain-containing protein [Vibrio aestuarianus]|uniref:VCBS domain-containing protein n=1 Tax=Vibrio aestuarianus TaxID=28171 RepID=A0AAX3U088_9VIBR|nr:VCBS domain-containing protein [Vibrio aestuarianus]WGK80535.1 VCBS domain-containing protein [Vibrio aestuarianus]